MSSDPTRVAYFSMEIALDPTLPTYAGGLGILSHDLLCSAADLGLPMVGVTLLYRAGYFSQSLDAEGRQHEIAASWIPEQHLALEEVRVALEIEGRSVSVRVLRYDLVGRRGVVPVYLLDTDLPGNDARDRTLTGALYGGDLAYRLGQEIVLGVGGARLLAQLYPDRIRKLHLNEGHAALAAWTSLPTGPLETALAALRRRCVFTTHTPVAAGRDRFPRAWVERFLPATGRDELLALGGGGELDMTSLALACSGRVNAVSARHRTSAREMFPGHDIGSITNGVHLGTWACAPVASVLDRYIAGWREDPSLLRRALAIPDAELWAAHEDAKAALLRHVKEKTGGVLDPARLTIVFARRAAAYKRMDLIFSDLDRLRALGRRGVQVILAGKAHPHDGDGKELIRSVIASARTLAPDLPIVYVPDYDFASAQRFVAGADVWLNTPTPPFEASGTSGMKAACNGVPSLSTLDGWWCEGHVEGATGWAIEGAADLYDKLERLVLPAFADRSAWAGIMKHCLALNASFFNSDRALRQYWATVYADE